MSLTFPRAMPTAGVERQELEPLRFDYLAPETGGHVGAVGNGFPLWRMDLQLAEMDSDEARPWRAFLKSLKGAARTFYARHLNRDWPAAYPSGFGGLVRAGTATPLPSDGAPTSWSVDATREILTLNGMPPSFVLTMDDPIGFAWTTSSEPRRTMASAVETVTGNGSGVVVVTIDPPLPTLVPGGATISLHQPTVIMRIDTGSTKLGGDDAVSTGPGRIVAIQDLRE